MLRRTLTLAAVSSLLLAGCGGDAPKQGAKRKKGPILPGQVIKNQAGLKAASVRGGAYPVGRDRFVLAGKEQSIFVLADPSLVKRVRKAGEQLVASGEVKAVTAEQSKTLESDVAELPKGEQVVEVTRARRAEGEPYLEADRVGPLTGAKKP